MTFNFLRPGLTVNVEAKVQEQIILDSSGFFYNFCGSQCFHAFPEAGETNTVDKTVPRKKYENHSKNQTIDFSLLVGCDINDDKFCWSS